MEFTLEDVSGKEFLLPMLQAAFLSVRETLSEIYAGPVLEHQLAEAAMGMREQAKALGDMINTESAARTARVEHALYDVGLIRAGVSPVDVPAKYPDS